MSRFFQKRRFNPDLTLPVSQVQATGYAYQLAYLEWVIRQLEQDIATLDLEVVHSENGSGNLQYRDPVDMSRMETVGRFDYSLVGTSLILHFNTLTAPTISLTGVSVTLPELSGKVRIPTTRGVWKTVDDEGIYVLGTTEGGDVYLTLTGSGSTTSVLTNLPKLSDYTISLIAFEKS